MMTQSRAAAKLKAVMTQSVTVLTRSHLYRNHVHVRCERNFEASRRSMTPGVRCFANMPSNEKKKSNIMQRKRKKESKSILAIFVQFCLRPRLWKGSRPRSAYFPKILFAAMARKALTPMYFESCR